MKTFDFPEFRQTYGYDCGAKAAQAVLAYYGMDVREYEMMKKAGTSKTGTPIKGIVRVLTHYGLKCKVGKMNTEQVKAFIDKKIPVILVLQAWTEKKKVNWKKDWIDGHYVVAVGYDEHRLYFEDPSAVLRTYLSYRELADRWHDKDIDGKKYLNCGIAVTGKKPVYSLTKKRHMD